MATAPKVAVIGGGYAGMAAAVTLAAQNIAVTVYEAGKQLGGRARRVEHRDTVLDNGLHILSGAYTETLRLLRLVNPQHATALLRVPLAWHMHNEFDLVAPRLPAPLHLLAALLTARGAGLRERLAMLQFLAALQRAGFRLAVDCNVEQLLAHFKQSEFMQRVFWRPLCVAALNTPPALASAQIFVNVLRDTMNASREASDLLLSRVDLSALFPEPAAEYLQAHGGSVALGRRVTGIDCNSNRFAVATAGGAVHFTHVVCALPPHQVGAFLGGMPALADTVAMLEQFTYQPIYSVWLQYATPVTLPAPMLGFADGPLHWVFDREALCGQRGLIGAVISAAGAHQELAQDELGTLAHTELARRLGNLPAAQWIRVIAEKRATFACTPGLRRPACVTPLENFYLAGDYTASDYPATIESAVRSGLACAEHIAQSRSGRTT
jgi:squalene-associated FAD-dependent desaturase